MKYVTPEMEAVKLEPEDIITTSLGGNTSFPETGEGDIDGGDGWD